MFIFRKILCKSYLVSFDSKICVFFLLGSYFICKLLHSKEKFEIKLFNIIYMYTYICKLIRFRFRTVNTLSIKQQFDFVQM